MTLEDKGADELTPEEAAYFESGGEAEIQEAPDTEEAENPEVKAESEDQPKGEAGEKQDENQPRDEKGRFVPHQALHAEREEHKKTRAELQELKEFRARMEERWRLFEQMQQQPQQEKAEDVPPDPNEDIFAFSQWQAQRVAKLEQTINEERQRQAQAAQVQQQFSAAFQNLNRSLETFRQSAPDIDDASNWLYDTRLSQLKAQGYDDQSAAAVIQHEVFGGILNAQKLGIEPAEYFYQYAKVSGYQPKAKEQGGVQMPEQLQRVAKAQEASKTVGQASGKAGADEVTAEMLANMSEQEFSAWVSKPENARKFEKLMGA